MKLLENGIMATPNLQRLQPIRAGSSLVCPQPQECPCHTCTDNLRRSLLVDQAWPNTHLLPCVPFHLPSSFRETVSCLIVELVRWPDSAESLYVDIRSRGNSECLLVQGELRLQENESVRHPTADH
jgi:hypothetical protein